MLNRVWVDTKDTNKWKRTVKEYVYRDARTEELKFEYSYINNIRTFNLEDYEEAKKVIATFNMEDVTKSMVDDGWISKNQYEAQIRP